MFTNREGKGMLFKNKFRFCWYLALFHVEKKVITGTKRDIGLDCEKRKKTSTSCPLN